MRTDTPHFGVRTITPPDASILKNLSQIYVKKK